MTESMFCPVCRRTLLHRAAPPPRASRCSNPACLATSGRIDYPSLVLEELAGLAEQFPAESLEAVQSIVRGAEEGWEVIAGREHIRAVLAAGLRNPATRERAESLTHELGARGYTEFRSVLDQT